MFKMGRMQRLPSVAVLVVLVAMCISDSAALIYLPTNPTAALPSETTASESDTSSSPVDDDGWTQLENWRIQKEDRVELNPQVFNNCSVSTRCIGLPTGCLQTGTCSIFAEIKLAEDFGSFQFRMYILLREERAHETPRYWVSVGLNKDAQRMAGANVMICYFRNDAMGVPADGVFYGWTDGQKRVIPVDEDEISFLHGVHHLKNIRMMRENRDTLFKCFFERKFNTEVVIDKTKYPEVTAAVEEHSVSFYLKEDSVFLIMAMGELDPRAIEPAFKPHNPSYTASTDKTRIGFSQCINSLCFGIGPDGCEHTTDVPCNLSMIMTPEYVHDGKRIVKEMAVWMKVQNVEGFVALGWSPTTKSEEAISKLTLLLSCNRKKGFAWKFHVLTACSREPSLETLVVCNATEVKEGNPFALKTSGGSTISAGIPDFDGVLCGETFPWKAVMQFRVFPKYYLYLLSGDEGDFDDVEGKIRLHITETPSVTSIRSKSSIPFPTLYSDFYVLSSEAGHHENRTLGTAGDLNFGEWSGEPAATKINSIHSVLVTFTILTSFLVVTFLKLQ